MEANYSYLLVVKIIMVILSLSLHQAPEEDHSPPTPKDEHRDMPPQPDQLLTSAFLRGEYCLVGVSEHVTTGRQLSYMYFELSIPFFSSLLFPSLPKTKLKKD